MPFDQSLRKDAHADETRSKLFRSTKSYGHAEGLSCTFRQWRAAHSHCRFVHGYALAFKFVFVADELDVNNWCFDFGSLKPVKAWLHEMFDHTLLVAADDPELDEFERLAERGIVALRVVPAVGCEAVARFTFEFVTQFAAEKTGGRVRLEMVEVSEHSGNAASYSEEHPERLHVAVPAHAEPALGGVHP